MNSINFMRILGRSRCFRSSFTYKSFQPKCGFHFTATNYFKKYRNVENDFTYGILKSNLKLDYLEDRTNAESSDINVDQILNVENFTTKSNEEFLEDFQSLGKG